MSLREAIHEESSARAAALLSLVGGTTILVTDDKVVSTLMVGVTVGVVVKMLVTYAALFGAGIWGAADLVHSGMLSDSIANRIADDPGCAPRTTTRGDTR